MDGTALAVYSVIAVYTTVVEAATFIGMYHLMSVREGHPWYASPIGRNLMAFVAVDGCVFTFLGLAYAFPQLATYTWFTWAYLLVGISGFPWVIAWRIAVLWRLYHPRGGPDGL